MQLDATNQSDRIRRLALIARLCTIFVLVAMFAGTHMPVSINHEIGYGDKSLHFWAYLTLAFGAAASWDLAAGRLQAPQYLLVWFVCVVYAALDEITQIPVGRSCDPMDWVFDAVGAAVGLTLFRLMRPLVYRLALMIPTAAANQ